MHAHDILRGLPKTLVTWHQQLSIYERLDQINEGYLATMGVKKAAKQPILRRMCCCVCTNKNCQFALGGTDKSQIKMACLDQSHFRHYFQFDKSIPLCVSNSPIESCSEFRHSVELFWKYMGYKTKLCNS